MYTHNNIITARENSEKLVKLKLKTSTHILFFFSK
jgi:hypothetical protein